jgi:hypothetical protein
MNGQFESRHQGAELDAALARAKRRRIPRRLLPMLAAKENVGNRGRQPAVPRVLACHPLILGVLSAIILETADEHG